MTGRGPFIPALVALVALSGGLAAAMHGALTASAPGLAVATAPRQADPMDAPGPAAVPEDRTGAWLATTLARPLFDPRRRPAAEAAAPAAGLPRLTGVVVGAFGSAAIFEGQGGGRSLSVREGDALHDYVVHSIAPGEAILVGPAGRVVLRPAIAPADQSGPAALGALPGPGASRRTSMPQGRRLRTVRRANVPRPGRAALRRPPAHA